MKDGTGVEVFGNRQGKGACLCMDHGALRGYELLFPLCRYVYRDTNVKQHRFHSMRFCALPAPSPSPEQPLLINS